MSEWSLTAADFPWCTEETFDAWIPPTDQKREKRPAPPMTIPQWRRQATNQIKAFGLVMGRGHMAERFEAMNNVELLHERMPHRYTREWLLSTWEELWWR